MIDVTTLLVVALILLQLYICACTYWVFKKIDRYENVAFAVIEKYLSTRNSQSNLSTDITNSVSAGMDVTSIDVTSIDVSAGMNTPLLSLVDQNSPALVARERIIYLVNKVNSFAPTRVQIAVHTLMTKWYSQLGLDLLSLGLCVNYDNSPLREEIKTIKDVETE